MTSIPPSSSPRAGRTLFARSSTRRRRYCSIRHRAQARCAQSRDGGGSHARARRRAVDPRADQGLASWRRTTRFRSRGACGRAGTCSINSRSSSPLSRCARRHGASAVSEEFARRARSVRVSHRRGPRVETRPASFPWPSATAALERDFLSELARHPFLALVHADALARTRWHEAVHATLAESMLQTLVDDPAATTGKILDAAARACPLHPRS